LRRGIDAVRAREGEVDAARRPAWLAVRGEVHRSLAARGSRMGVFDLRETFARAGGPLPVGFISAVSAVGDRSCHDALAAAWTTSAAEAERWWRDHLADAFRAIVERERLTRTAPELRRILERRPAAGPRVALARRR
jgi:hypothetical protein